MKLKTSTRISLKFTILSFVIIAIFSVIISVGFFGTWYFKQKEILIHNRDYEKPFFLNIIENEKGIKKEKKPEGTPKPMNNNIRMKIQEISVSEFNNEEYSILQTLQSITHDQVKIFVKDEKYFLYEIQGKTVKSLDITEFVYAQLELLGTLGMYSLLFIVIVYLISLFFVKTSFKNLKKLTDFAKDLKFDDLSQRIEIEGAKNDEIKLIADALNTSLEKINYQVESLKDFIGNASHELKTPLMMINTEIDLALKKKDYPERLTTIKTNTKRIANLLDHLSLITRLESSSHFDSQELNLFEVFTNIQESLEMKYPTKKIQFQGDKKIIITANENLLSMVIKNLLENACKYAGDAAEIFFIQNSHSFSVKDTGKGIPLEEQEKIFERFWQSEKIENESHSFGLGLYLVKKIVRLQKWTLHLESEVGKGAEFIVSFGKDDR